MIVRVKKDKDYAVMSNYHFKDKNLSLRVKGLLSLMLSLPDVGIILLMGCVVYAMNLEIQ